MLIDSHAHLNMPDFDHDRDQVLSRAFQAGISAVLCPAEATDPRNIAVTREMLHNYPNIFAAAGIHPHAAKDFSPESMDRIHSLAENNQIKGIGEIGLDFHYNFSARDKQIAVFRRQLSLALELKLPVIVHSRLAAAEVLTAVKEENYDLGGILHCFTEDWDFARNMLELGFYISFSGIVTFPQAFELRETAKKIPLEKMLVETDSPFLTPVPFRGKIKRNEPYYVKETAAFLAELKNTDLENFSRITTNNFKSCLGIEIKNF